MKIFYSASRRGFFSPAVHAELPEDAVPVARRRHAALIAAHEKGAQIIPNAAGAPTLDWPDRGISIRRAALIRQVKREARRRIRGVSPEWRQMNDMREPSEAGAARFAAIDALRRASAAIEAEVAALPVEALDSIDVRRHPRWSER